MHLITNIKFKISDKIFVKDPETSALGKKIIKESIILIDEGFDNFTFKKLGERIGSMKVRFTGILRTSTNY
jgi:hypothetical protein